MQQTVAICPTADVPHFLSKAFSLSPLVSRVNQPLQVPQFAFAPSSTTAQHTSVHCTHQPNLIKVLQAFRKLFLPSPIDGSMNRLVRGHPSEQWLLCLTVHFTSL